MGLVSRPPSPAGMLTTARGGGGRGVAPLAPDPCFLGAIDAKGIATHLHEIDCAWLQAGQAARGLVADIVHHLVAMAGSEARGGGGGRGGAAWRGGVGIVRHLPVHAVLHSVADLVLGLEEEVLEGRWGNPAHTQLVLQAPNSAHVHVGWGIGGH